MLGNIASLLGIFQNLMILVFMLWVGNKAAKPFKSWVPFFVYAFLILLIGLAAYFTGLVISTNFLPNLPFGLSDYIGALIAAGLIYSILWLLLSRKGYDTVFTKREDFEKLKKHVALLSEKINAIGKSAGIKKLSGEALKSALKNVMSDAGLDNYKIKSKEVKDDELVVILTKDSKAYKLRISLYSGDLLSKERTATNFIQGLYRYAGSLRENKKRIFGILALIMFVLFFMTLNVQPAVGKITNFIGISVPNSSQTLCYGVISAFPELASFQFPNETAINVNILNSVMNSSYSQVLATKVIGNQTYVLAIKGTSVCSVKYPIKACECIDAGQILGGLSQGGSTQ